MNKSALNFISFIRDNARDNNKTGIIQSAIRQFGLTRDGRALYHNDGFAVRFCYSKSSSDKFSNTVLSLSKLEKYDYIPVFVVLIRRDADNLIFLANTSCLKKISHSSQALSMTNIKGSFNGSDIMREVNDEPNIPENFESIFAYHQGWDWQENLERLVEATNKIKPHKEKFSPTPEGLQNIYGSVERANRFICSHEYTELDLDLRTRCHECRDAIIVASHIPNTNVRGRLIESLITSDAGNRAALLLQLKDIEKELPVYDTRNELGDYHRAFDEADTYTDIKTKIIYLDSNPKAFNVDKFLEKMSEPRSVLLFFFVGIDEAGNISTKLCPVYERQLIKATILQNHWAGRATRGAAQYQGAVINSILQIKDYHPEINEAEAKHFLTDLLDR